MNWLGAARHHALEKTNPQLSHRPPAELKCLSAHPGHFPFFPHSQLSWPIWKRFLYPPPKRNKASSVTLVKSETPLMMYKSRVCDRFKVQCWGQSCEGYTALGWAACLHCKGQKEAPCYSLLLLAFAIFHHHEPLPLHHMPPCLGAS